MQSAKSCYWHFIKREITAATSFVYASCFAKKNVDIKENVSADKTHYGFRILFEVASSKKNVDIKENVSAD